MRRSLEKECEKARVLVSTDALETGVIITGSWWGRILDQF
jgi:hypothetical protein